MSKRMELYDDSIDGIVDQMQTTVSDLKVKRELLLNQIDLYKGLKAKIDVKVENTTVLLGDGYFVEMIPENAKAYLMRRITNVSEIVEGFNTKIRDAEYTMDHISKLREEETKSGRQDSSNEEGLPFLDIQEELDDEDNIMSVKINNKTQSFENSARNKEDSTDDGPSLMNIQEELDEDGNLKSTKINNKFQKIDDRVEEKHEQDLKQNEPSIPSERNQNSKRIEELDDEDDDQVSELLQDMGIVKSNKSEEINIVQDKLLDKIDQLKINADDKFKLKQICVESIQDQNFEKIDSDMTLDKVGTKTEEEVVSDMIVENNLQDLLGTDHVFPRQKNSESNQLETDGNEILELELIADKFDDTNNSSTHADDEEWDFEFEEGDEEEVDDFSDDLLYGNSRATFIPETESHDRAQNLNNLLWNQVMELRNKKPQVSSSNSTNSLKKKSVRFSEELEINEIENVSEELKKVDHFKRNISRFKQDRLNKSNGSEIEDVINQLEKSKSKTFESPVNDIIERDPVSDIAERDTISDPIERNEPVSNIVERNPIRDIVENEEPISQIVDLDEINKNTDASDTNKPRLSKFKQMKTTSASPQQLSTHVPIKTHIKPFEITDIEQGKTRKAALEESIKGTEDNPMHVMDTSLDYNSMQDDMDTMAKAYTLGMYDDDIMTEGPVVQQLDDFEKLNKIIESMPKREASLTAKSAKPANEKVDDIFDPYLDQVGLEYDDDEDDDDTPVLADILENDIVPPPDVEQTILDQEVTSNYHRLRQKLFFSNNNHQQDSNEFEPIDEHGNNVRVSKFKASKYRLNQL